MIREIVRIDENKCDGCGLCVPACAEGAIKIVDGKARLLADNLCDGLGACLGHCPKDAIIIEKRAAAEFDEAAVEQHLKAEGKPLPAQHGHGHAPGHGPGNSHGHGGGCPSAQVKTFTPAAHGHGGGCPSAAVRNVAPAAAPAQDIAGQRPSELRQWPVQMHLVPPTAPFLKNADVVLAADCVAFAYADFHKDFLQGKALLIGCPKLDDGQAYLQKLTAMLQQNSIKSLTVLHMEVPCCSGLVVIARQALAASGAATELKTVRIGIQGEVK